jgi:hypothetical protein
MRAGNFLLMLSGMSSPSTFVSVGVSTLRLTDMILASHLLLPLAIKPQAPTGPDSQPNISDLASFLLLRFPTPSDVPLRTGVNPSGLIAAHHFL